MIGMRESVVPEALIVDRLDEVLSIAGEDIHRRLGSCGVSAVAYDTAWVARIEDPSGEPEFPNSLDWLVANQRDDGSWGADVYHEYDRFLNTLSAAIALKQWDHRPEAVAMAEAYLTQAIERLEGSEQGKGSDHIISMLMHEAKRVGLDLPYERSPHKPYSLIKRLYMSYRYADVNHPLSFFSELFGRLPNQQRIVTRTQVADGSLGSATAPTAASIVFDVNPRRDHSYYHRLRFLREFSFPDGGVRHFGNFDVMERVYGLYHLMWVLPRSDAFIEEALRLVKEHWREGGLSFGAHFPVPDLDNTAMAYRFLKEIGREPDPHVLDRYWKEERWTVYEYHHRADAGPNLHALEAIAISKHPERDHLIDTTLRFVKSIMRDGNHFIDEWCLSPAYPTSHAIRAFHLTEETLMERCLSFFLDTQHDDGSWGFIDNGNGLGTLEETAYALQGLLYYNQEVEPIDLEPINRGVDYILAGYPAPRYPEIWIAKVLYAPLNMIEGVVEGALLMYKQQMKGQ